MIYPFLRPSRTASFHFLFPFSTQERGRRSKKKIERNAFFDFRPVGDMRQPLPDIERIVSVHRKSPTPFLSFCPEEKNAAARVWS